MTLDELAARLRAIGAYSVVQRDNISIQIERNRKLLTDGWFHGPISDAEKILRQAEARATKQDPADIEYLSWGVAA